MMTYFIRKIIPAISSLCLIFSIQAYSQCLTGTWEGQLFSGVFLQMNIVQSSSGTCASSYDYVKSDPGNHCRQYLNLSYNKKNDQWEITSVSFAENDQWKDGSKHLPLHLLLKYSEKNGKAILSGQGYDQLLLSKNTRREVYLERVSDTLREILPGIRDCMMSAEYLRAIPFTQNNRQSLNENAVISKNTTRGRPSSIISVIRSSSAKISVRLFDNAIIDEDSVSVYFDGKIILSNQRLTGRSINFELDLGNDGTPHELTLVADNTGIIPPNTARLVITAGSYRYELNAQSDMHCNASVILQYDP